MKTKSGCEMLNSLNASKMLKDYQNPLSQTIMDNIISFPVPRYKYVASEPAQVKFEPQTKQLSESRAASPSKLFWKDTTLYPKRVETYAYSNPNTATSGRGLPHLGIFERIHLSPIDEEIIESFYIHITKADSNSWMEEKLFDIMCFDFGAQVFLQYSKVLQVSQIFAQTLISTLKL
jgi:hypothetical protein